MIELNDNHEYVEETFKKMLLIESVVQKTIFDGCSFDQCDFSQTQFKFCKFIECTFTNCNLSLLKLPNSEYNDVSFEGCKLIGIDWSKASWSILSGSGALKFENCNLSDSSFYGLKLHELVIKGCQAKDVDFREGDFSRADFSDSDFREAMFANSKLEKVNFVDATNFYIDINKNNLRQAKFRSIDAVALLEPLGLDLV